MIIAGFALIHIHAYWLAIGQLGYAILRLSKHISSLYSSIASHCEVVLWRCQTSPALTGDRSPLSQMPTSPASVNPLPGCGILFAIYHYFYLYNVDRLVTATARHRPARSGGCWSAIKFCRIQHNGTMKTDLAIGHQRPKWLPWVLWLKIPTICRVGRRGVGRIAIFPVQSRVVVCHDF